MRFRTSLRALSITCTAIALILAAAAPLVAPGLVFKTHRRSHVAMILHGRVHEAADRPPSLPRRSAMAGSTCTPALRVSGLVKLALELSSDSETLSIPNHPK